MTTPKLRFKQFDNAWRKVKLQEITSRIGDGLHSTPEYDEEGIIYFANGSNIKNGFLVFDENTKTINEDELSKYKVHLEHNSILVSLNGATWGRFGLYNGEKILLGKSLGYINTLDSHTAKHFIYYQLQLRKIRKFFESDITGSTIKNLSLQTLRNTEVYLPSIEEQKKIANFLIVIDKKIQLQQEKIDLLKEQKKGYMQKIFNQKIRFNSNSPEWTHTNLGDISLIEKGNQLNKDTLSKIKNNYNPFPVYNGGVSPSGYTNIFNRKKDNIIISEGGNSCGYVNFINESFFSGGHSYTISILNESNIDKYFLYSYLKYMQKSIMNLRVGSGLPNIQKNALTKFKVIIPHMEEQKKISEFLSCLDKKIELETEKLYSLVSQKQAFMQQMFI